MFRRKTGRMLLGQALPLVESIVALLRERTGVEKISPAGSIRRMKETIGDIDILVASSRPQRIMDVFCCPAPGSGSPGKRRYEVEYCDP